MTFSRIAVLVGLALAVMVAGMAITFLYMVVYSYVIDPGHDEKYYKAHVQIAAPYCSIVAGIPLMFLVGWWLGWREAAIVWLAYTVIDLGIVVAAGAIGQIGVLVVFSLLTKLGAAYVGALVGSWRG